MPRRFGPRSSHGFWRALSPRRVRGDRHRAPSPALCNANNIDVVVSKDKTSIVDPDTVTYTVSVTNGGAGACDVRTRPSPSVAPQRTARDGTLTTFTTTGSFPADGSGDTTYAP